MRGTTDPLGENHMFAARFAKFGCKSRATDVLGCHASVTPWKKERKKKKNTYGVGICRGNVVRRFAGAFHSKWDPRTGFKSPLGCEIRAKQQTNLLETSIVCVKSSEIYF